MNSTVALDALVKGLDTDVINFTASRYLSVAGFCLLIYDHFLTIDDEVDLIWPNPFKPVSSLFLFNRYIVPIVVTVDMYDKLGFARNVSNEFCSSWLVFEGLAQTLCFGITHILVALRVRALYSKERWVDWTLCVAGTAYFIATVVLTASADSIVARNIHWDSNFNLCLATIPSWTFGIWCPALLFESLLFVLTGFKALEHRRRNITMPVTSLLYRDGFVFFVVIASCSVFNVVVWAALSPSLIALAKYFSFGVVNTMSSRLVLNLRSLRQGSEDGFTVYPSHSGLEMQDYRHSSYGPDFQCAGLSPNHLSVSFGSRNGLVRDSFTRPPSMRALSALRETRSMRSMATRSQPPTPTVLEVRMEVDVDIEVDDGGYDAWKEGSDEFYLGTAI